MSRHVASAPPQWVPGFELKSGSVVAGPIYLFDFPEWQTKAGTNYTGVRFVVINTGTTPLTVTPEASYDAQHVEVGTVAPQAFTVEAGNCYGDPYGIDEMRPFFRLSVSGTGAFTWGVLGIPR